MERTKFPSIRVVGLFPGGIMVVRRLYEADPERCGYFVCDTGPGFLEASPVPDKLLLGKDERCFPGVVVNGAGTLVLIAALDGPDAASSAEMLLSMATRAKEAGVSICGIISCPMDGEEKESSIGYVKEMEGWEESYIQVIDPRLVSFGYRFRPRAEVMRRRIRDAMADEAEGLIRDRLYWEERFAPIFRKLDELTGEHETNDGDLPFPKNNH